MSTDILLFFSPPLIPNYAFGLPSQVYIRLLREDNKKEENRIWFAGGIGSSSKHHPAGKQWLFVLTPCSRNPHTWAECSTGTGLCFPTQVTQRFSNLSRRGSKSEIEVCVLSPLLLYEQTANPKFKASNAAGIVPQRLQEQQVPDLDHVELRDAIFLHAHRERNAIFLYQHLGYTNLLAAQKHNPKAFSKGSLNNGKEMHRGSLKQIERKGEEREKWLFSILMAEHPIQEKKNQKTNNNRQTLIFVIAISIIAERRIPGVLPDL